MVAVAWIITMYIFLDETAGLVVIVVSKPKENIISYSNKSRILCCLINFHRCYRAMLRQKSELNSCTLQNINIYYFLCKSIWKFQSLIVQFNNTSWNIDPPVPPFYFFSYPQSTFILLFFFSVSHKSFFKTFWTRDD